MIEILSEYDKGKNFHRKEEKLLLVHHLLLVFNFLITLSEKLPKGLNWYEIFQGQFIFIFLCENARYWKQFAT